MVELPPWPSGLGNGLLIRFTQVRILPGVLGVPGQGGKKARNDMVAQAEPVYRELRTSPPLGINCSGFPPLATFSTDTAAA